MKRTRFITITLAPWLLLPFAATTSTAQGAAFVYQGRLSNGAMTSGNYDLLFTVHDAATLGSQVAGPLTNTVTVDGNGLFSASLDFGAGVFTGAPRWLQIGVRTNGAGDFTDLSPRQALTPSPYALYAPNAGASATAISAANVAAEAVGNAGLQNNAVDSSKIADGSITANDLNNAILNNTFWKLAGNGGTAAGMNFLGTTDNQPLELRVNGVRALRIEPTTSSPNMIGGWSNNVVGPLSIGATIGGGGSNTIQFDNLYSTIGGGYKNQISFGYAAFSTVAGGNQNMIGESQSSAIGGGEQNEIASFAFFSTIAGGIGSFIGYNSDFAVIVGGSHNKVGSYSDCATIGGGRNNTIDSPGLDTKPSVTIAGGEGNIILSSGYATIGGGNSNVVQLDSDFATIGGGNQNRAESDGATISGGWLNTASGTNATVGGGYSNSVGGVNSTIGGGLRNRIYVSDDTADYASLNTIAGGGSNSIRGLSLEPAFADTIGGGVANGIGKRTKFSTIGGGNGNGINNDNTASTIGGGIGNFVDSGRATVAGGSSNQIISYTFDGSAIGGGRGNMITYGVNSTIGGGEENSIDNGGSGGATIGGGAKNSIRAGGDPGFSNGTTISGGNSNTVTASLGTIPGGAQAKAANYGQLAYASGGFETAGDAQTSVYVCRGTTTNAVPADLFLDGLSRTISIPPNSTWTFDILITGRSPTGTSGGYQVRGVIKNIAGTTTLVAPADLFTLAEDASTWTATAVADDESDALIVRVTGAPATTIRWVASVRTVELTF